MYPKKLKKTKYKLLILEFISNLINITISCIKSFKSPIALIIFLEKSFHF